MNTKEAIDFLRLKIVPPKWDEEKYKGLKRVIELLQRGKKFEAMCGEIECNLLNFINVGTVSIIDGMIVKKMIEIIKQKYFPKEIIEEVVKGITEQIKEGAEIAREEAKTDEDKMD